MHWFFLKRFLIVVFALLAAGLVAFVSLWKLNLTVQGVEDHDYSATVSAGERLKQLFTPPILPDHPLYVFGMIADRLDLMLATPEQQFMLKLKYADTRLATAQALIARKRFNMALSSATKAEKYIFSAAEEIPILPADKQKDAVSKLTNTIGVHEQVLTAMKPSFSDPQKATVDSLIEQILILTPNR